MLVVRFKVQCQPAKTPEVASAMAAVVTASRDVAGVVHFDIGRDLTNDDVLVATEVFEDAAARERQEALPEVATVMALLPTALAGPPEMTVLSAQTIGA